MKESGPYRFHLLKLSNMQQKYLYFTWNTFIRCYDTVLFELTKDTHSCQEINRPYPYMLPAVSITQGSALISCVYFSNDKRLYFDAKVNWC